MARRFDRTLDEVEALLGHGLEAERAAAAPGWLQQRDPRAKALAALALLLALSFVHRPAVLTGLYGLMVWVAATTRIPVGRLLRREWLIAGLFTGFVALPAVFLTPGPPLARLPGGLALTATGVESASRLLLRSVASIHIALLLMQVTPWHRFLQGLRGLGAPALFVMILAVSHRYLVLLATTAREMMLGREARRVGRLPAGVARRQIAASAGALLIRTQDTGEAVYKAMAARGWRGEPRHLAVPRWAASDTLLCAAALGLAIAVYGMDRYVIR